MKSIYLILVSSLIISIISCSPEPPDAGPIISPTNLPTSTFDLLEGQDSMFVGGEGIRMYVQSCNWLTADSQAGAWPIHIELREALSVTDMILGGLSTHTEDFLLESGGMFYWDATDAKRRQVEPTKAVGFEVPKSATETKKMSLFEGVLQEGGEVVWGNIQGIEPDDDLEADNRGMVLYRQYCTSCHKINRAMTGPALLGARQKFEKEWLYEFTRNAPGLINAGDPLAVARYEEWGTMMQAFPMLSYSDIEEIYDFIDLGQEVEPLLSLASDSTTSMNLPITTDTTWEEQDHTGHSDFTEANKKRQVFYSLQVSQPGWYNIDRLYKKPMRELAFQASLSEFDSAWSTVSLVMMDRKIMLNGRHVGGGNFIFNYSFPESQNSYLPLAQAVLLVGMTMKEDQVYFGVAETVTQDEATIPISMKSVPFEEIRKRLESIF